MSPRKAAWQRYRGKLPKRLRGAMAPLLSCVCANVGVERDPQAASVANLRAGVSAIKGDDDIAHLIQTAGLRVVPALYHTEDGIVEFMEL